MSGLSSTKRDSEGRSRGRDGMDFGDDLNGDCGEDGSIETPLGST